MSDAELKEKEESAALDDTAADFSPQERAEFDKLADNDPGPEDSGPKRKGRWGRLSRRQKTIIGGGGGLLIGGGFGLLTIIQGPLQIVSLSSRLSNIFFTRNNNTQDISARRIYHVLASESEQNNLGILGNRLVKKNIADLTSRGITLSFDNPDGKHRSLLQSISVDPNSAGGKQLLDRALADGFQGSISNGPDGTKIIDVRGRSGGQLARALSEEMVDVTGKKGVSGFLTKRRLRKFFRADFHPLNIARREGESLSDYYGRRRDERAQEAKDGTQAGDVREGSGSDADGDGTNDAVDPDVAGEGGSVEDLVDEAGRTRSPSQLRAKISDIKASRFFKGGATGAAIVAVTCAVKDMGDNIPKYKMLNVIAPLVRLSTQYVAAGSQVQAMQDIDIAEVGSITQALHDDETGSWAAAAPLKAAEGESGGTELDPATKSQIQGAYKGDKPSVFSAIDNIPFVDQACGVNNWFGNLPIIKQFGDVSNQLVSGLASTVTGKSLEDWMGQFVAMLSGGAIDTLASGAALGNLLSYGSLLAANATSIALGGVEFTINQLGEWEVYNSNLATREKQRQSWQERMLNLQNPESVASITLLNASTKFSAQSIGGFMQRAPTSLTSNISSSFLKPFKGFASAQTVHGYDYGIPEYGIPLSTLDNGRYENPYDNIDRLEENDFAKLKTANENWGKCFGNPLDDRGSLADKEADENTYKHLDSNDCKSAYNNPDFQDYQMYILDNVTIRSLACYEGVDETQCAQLGFGSQQTTGSAPAAGSFAGTDTSSQSCSVGTDAGIEDTPDPNKKIRTCTVEGITVNVAIEQNVKAAVTGARAAGLTLGGSGYRSYDSQVSLRREHCGTSEYDIYQKPAGECSPSTARPGTSLHEWGVAVDFTCNGGSVTREGPCFRWLESNQGVHNLINLPSEPWHWSSTGN